MKLFFGKKKEEEVKPQVDLPSAIKQNKEAISTLEKRQCHLEKKILAQDEDARERARTGDKRGALLALKRKKLYNGELDQLNNARLTLESQIMTLESAQTQRVAVGALAVGVDAQKQINKQMDISKIDQLMEDMQEQQDLQGEVAQVLSQGNQITDDDELLNELSMLEAEELDKKLVNAGPVPQSVPSAGGIEGISEPSVPSSVPSAPVAVASKPLSDEEQLAQLKAELA